MWKGRRFNFRDAWQQQLADSLGIHRNDMAAIIGEVEAAGRVQRRLDPDDRHAVAGIDT